MSTTMQGVGKTSLVIPRKSLRAMRCSNSAKLNSVPMVFAAQTRAMEAVPTAAAPAMRKSRRDFIEPSYSVILHTLLYSDLRCKRVPESKPPGRQQIDSAEVGPKQTLKD